MEGQCGADYPAVPLMSEPVPIWLDCDPGTDDAYAILLAACHPAFNLVGVSTVHGNAPLSATSENAAALLQLLNFNQGDIEVYAGCDKPMHIAPKHALDVHGSLGIGDIKLPKLSIPVKSGYLEAIKNAVEKHNLVVVCTGALTNFANFVMKYPDLLPRIRAVSIMGGAIQCGNMTKYAEFNIGCDPHAAEIVIGCKALQSKTVLCPLNFTHTVIATEEIRKELLGDGSPLRTTFHNILTFYYGSYLRKYSHALGPPVHDPLAVFAALALCAGREEQASRYNFTYLKRKVHVVTSGARIGETVIENGNLDPLAEEEGIYIAQGINTELFWEFVRKAMAVASQR